MKMRKRLSAFFCFAVAFCLQGMASETISLNKGWKFKH